MATAFELKARLSAQVAPFERAMKKAGTATKKFANSDVKMLQGSLTQLGGKFGSFFGKIGPMVAAGGPLALAAAGVLALNSAFQKLKQTLTQVISKTNAQFDVLDSFAKQADKLGVVPDQLQRIGLAAKLTADVTDQQLAKALQRMVKRVGEAQAGSGELEKAFNRLGLSSAELINLDMEGQFLAIADGIKGLDSRTAQLAATSKIFDSEGVALVNTLAKGSEEIQRLGGDIDKFNLALSRADLQKIEDSNDAWTRVRQVIDGIYSRLAIEFAPVMEGIANVMLEAATGTEAWGGAIKALGEFARNVIPPIIDAVQIFIGGMQQLLGIQQLLQTQVKLVFGGPGAAIENVKNALKNINTGGGLVQSGISGNLSQQFSQAASQQQSGRTGIEIKKLTERQVKASESSLNELKSLNRSSSQNQVTVRSLF